MKKILIMFLLMILIITSSFSDSTWNSDFDSSAEKSASKAVSLSLNEFKERVVIGFTTDPVSLEENGVGAFGDVTALDSIDLVIDHTPGDNYGSAYVDSETFAAFYQIVSNTDVAIYLYATNKMNGEKYKNIDFTVTRTQNGEDIDIINTAGNINYPTYSREDDLYTNHAHERFAFADERYLEVRVNPDKSLYPNGFLSMQADKFTATLYIDCVVE